MILYPTPSYAGTISLHYYRLPTAPSSDSDTLDLPVGWEDCAYLYAEYLALRRDRDPRWQEALQAGMAPQVVLESTSAAALEVVKLADLKRYAVKLDQEK